MLGDPQITRGYCLLLPDPVVPHLNSLIGDIPRHASEEPAVRRTPVWLHDWNTAPPIAAAALALAQRIADRLTA